MLLEDIKKFVKELSNGELTHLDPSRVRIYLAGLIDRCQTIRQALYLS
jgi:type VI protein secretion system component VasA